MTIREGGSVRLDQAAREETLGPALDYSRFGVEVRALYGDFEFFLDRQQSGVIPYLPTGRLNLALGMPLAPFGKRRPLIEEYLWYCKLRGRIPAFYPVTRGFFDGLGDLGFGAIAAGVAGRVDLARLDEQDASFASVRVGVAHVADRGVTFRLVPGKELGAKTLLAMTDVGSVERAARERRGGPRLLATQAMTCAGRKLYGVAERNGVPVGFVSLVRGNKAGVWGVEAVEGDLPESDLCDYLLYQTLVGLRGQGQAEVSLGVVPLVHPTSRVAPPTAGEAVVAGQFYRWWFSHAPALGYARAWHRQQLRFRPHEFETQYFVFHPSQPRPEVVLGFLSGLCDGFDWYGLAAEWWSGWSRRLPRGSSRKKNTLDWKRESGHA